MTGRQSGTAHLRTTKAMRQRIEQMIARGHQPQTIADRLGVTVAQVAQVRIDMDHVLLDDEGGGPCGRMTAAGRCGLPTRLVPVHHANGVTTLHRVYPLGHAPQRRAPKPDSPRLAVVRGER